MLRFERNLSAWPHIRVRPAIVEGAGTTLCEDLERDLMASFLGRALFVNPLSEREIGFTPMPGLGNAPIVLRADIDAYNRGKPLPVLQWVADNGGRRHTVEYRAFDSPAALLSAIGRGGEPLAKRVREAGHPVIEIGRLTRLTADDMPRFFRYREQIYLLAPTQPVLGKPGDLGAYKLSGPSRLRRVCLFDTHPSKTYSTDVLSLPEVAALKRAAGPLLPAEKLCAAEGEQVPILAGWRPWVLERGRSPGALTEERLALYMRNRGLTGPESVRHARADGAFLRRRVGLTGNGAAADRAWRRCRQTGRLWAPPGGLRRGPYR